MVLRVFLGDQESFGDLLHGEVGGEHGEHVVLSRRPATSALDRECWDRDFERVRDTRSIPEGTRGPRCRIGV